MAEVDDSEGATGVSVCASASPRSVDGRTDPTDPTLGVGKSGSDEN